MPKRRRAQAGFEIVPARLLPGESFVRDAIPVCTVARVLFDLSRELTPEQLANVIHEAEFEQALPTSAAITRTTPVLAEALALHKSGSAGTRTGLEDRFLKLIRGAGLPEPVINTHHHGFEVDFRWPGLCVEIDGDHHDRARTQRDDRIQDAVLTSPRVHRPALPRGTPRPPGGGPTPTRGAGACPPRCGVAPPRARCSLGP